MVLPAATSAAFPWLVGVVGRPEAVARYADTDPKTRIIDLLEVRVDLFDVPEIADWAPACARLEASGTPVLTTIRSAAEGGRWAAPDEERLPLYREAVEIASWVDVEASSPIAREVTALAAARGRTSIVSHHDFESTPSLAELERIVDACRALGADVAKVATMVNADQDNDALFALLQKRPEGTCVIGMGARAQALRVELAARGSLLTYGYLDKPTAPGQISVAEMDQLLRAAVPAYAARRAAGITA
jgi:3-dehydroquinate dehydratase I